MSFSIKLFGGAVLTGPEGAITGPAVQRHRLALLSILAASGPVPVSRDKLLALLWPGRDNENARQLLNQAVHAVRRTLGAEAILSAGDDLQLNPAVVDCDVTRFEEALRRNEPESAVAVYAGPFLDGFFLDEAPEFERWVDRQRDRMAGLCGKALEELAQRAENAGDGTGAVEWWKRRAGLDPYDSRLALQLMRALEQAGNRAGALQHGRAHQQLLKAELDIEADPELLEAMEELRAEPRRPARKAATPVEVPALPLSIASPGPLASRTASPPPARPPRTRFMMPAGALLLAGVVLLGIVRLMARESPALSQPAVDQIAQAVARELARRQQGDSGAEVPPERRTRSIKAYELFLRGNAPSVLRNDSAARVALGHFQQAIALDSGYAMAWAGLSRLIHRVGEGRDPRGASEAAARRAIALDSSLAEPHGILAMQRSFEGDFDEAERHFQQALALEPNRARIREWHAVHYLAVGRPVEALMEAERALALEPLSPAASAEVARALLANDRCDEALARLLPLLELEPPLARAPPIAAHCYARKSMWAEAIAVMQRWSGRNSFEGQAFLGYLHARADRRSEAEAIHARLDQAWRNGTGGSYWLAWVPAGLGQRDSAFVWIERGIADSSIRRARFFPMGMQDALFDNLRDDPRLKVVAQRLIQ